MLIESQVPLAEGEKALALIAGKGPPRMWIVAS
jgi:hypothetical protein